MLSSILSQAGYRVGCFTSPDLIDFRDRISVNNLWISEEEVAGRVEQLLPILEDREDRPTLFEVLTAIAFAHFAKSRVKLAVVEVGLGGRFDATNVLYPLLTILTNVGRDHIALLGGMLKQIAWEKAGIAKAGVPMLTGELPPEAEEIVIKECEKARAPLVRCDPVAVERIAFNWKRATYRIEASDLPETVDLALLGGYQAGNLRLTLRAVELLRKAGFILSNDAVTAGLSDVSWPGRFEVIKLNPTIIHDGAHNLPAALALAKDVKRYVPKRLHRHLLFGILSDKEAEAICHVLFPLFAKVTLTCSQSPRALPLDLLAKIASSLGVECKQAPSVKEGLISACACLEAQDVLFVTGSLTVLREARPILMEAPCRP
jgi:dihydrofolate synthase/folylpolyglutamate synthase